MKASRHFIMIVILLFALSLLLGNAGYTVAAQTARTLLAVVAVLWLAFLAICYDQQQLNDARQAACDLLLAEQKRKFEESVELINLHRAQYRQSFFIPKEYIVVFDIVESKLEDTRRLASRLTLSILRAHHLKIAHDILMQQEKPLHDLYMTEKHREYTRMPYRVLLRLKALRKKISFYEAYFLVPELKKVYVLLREGKNPHSMEQKYGEQWELFLISEIERILCSIEAQLFHTRKPIQNRLL